MDKLCVLVAIEPRSYAGTIGTVVAELRPHLDVGIVEPEELTEEVDRLSPRLVICSRPDPFHSGDVVCWVQFTPYETEAKVKIRMDDRSWTLQDADLNTLLSLVDEATSRSNARPLSYSKKGPT